MKRLFWIVLVLVPMLMYGLPAVAEDETEGLGDYVHAVQGSGPRLNLPPGIFAQIASRADAFLAGWAKTIFAADVKKKMDEGEHLFVMDIRAKVDYDKGHIPGAVNIEFANAAKPESLALLPDNAQIIVVCYTSQTANEVTALLNVLGFDAWAMRFGMMGWRASTSMKIGSASQKAQNILGAGYPEVTY